MNRFIAIRYLERTVFDHSIVFEAPDEAAAKRRYMSHVFGIPYDDQTVDDTEATFKKHNVDVVPLNEEWSMHLKSYTEQVLARSSSCRV